MDSNQHFSTPVPAWPPSQASSAPRTAGYNTGFEQLYDGPQLGTPARKLTHHHSELSSGARRVIVTLVQEDRPALISPPVAHKERERGNYMRPTEAFRLGLEDAHSTPQRLAKKVSRTPQRTPTRTPGRTPKRTPETALVRHQAPATAHAQQLLQQQQTPELTRHEELYATPIRGTVHTPPRTASGGGGGAGGMILFSPLSATRGTTATAAGAAGSGRAVSAGRMRPEAAALSKRPSTAPRSRPSPLPAPPVPAAAPIAPAPAPVPTAVPRRSKLTTALPLTADKLSANKAAKQAAMAKVKPSRGAGGYAAPTFSQMMGQKHDLRHLAQAQQVAGSRVRKPTALSSAAVAGAGGGHMTGAPPAAAHAGPTPSSIPRRSALPNRAARQALVYDYDDLSIPPPAPSQLQASPIARPPSRSVFTSSTEGGNGGGGGLMDCSEISSVYGERQSVVSLDLDLLDEPPPPPPPVEYSELSIVQGSASASPKTLSFNTSSLTFDSHRHALGAFSPLAQTLQSMTTLSLLPSPTPSTPSGSVLSALNEGMLASTSTAWGGEQRGSVQVITESMRSNFTAFTAFTAFSSITPIPPPTPVCVEDAFSFLDDLPVPPPPVVAPMAVVTPVAEVVPALSRSNPADGQGLNTWPLHPNGQVAPQDNQASFRPSSPVPLPEDDQEPAFLPTKSLEDPVPSATASARNSLYPSPMHTPLPMRHQFEDLDTSSDVLQSLRSRLHAQTEQSFQIRLGRDGEGEEGGVLFDDYEDA